MEAARDFTRVEPMRLTTHTTGGGPVTLNP
jgi:hypothetical protein